MNISRIRISRKKIAGTLAVLLALGAITIGVRQLLGIYDESEKLLPLIPTHPVVAKAPETLWSDSLNIGLPADLSTPPQSSCSEQGSNWLESENLNTGSDMNSQAWRDLRSEEHTSELQSH